MRRPSSYVSRAALALALAASLFAPPADAKLGSGGSSGSRGTRTFSAPPPTATAPRATQPMQRTETPNLGPARPGMAPAATPSRFGTGMMAGLLGAGVLGLLFGGGFLGGLSGLTSLIGLVFQVALIGGLVWLAFRFFRSRREPAMAGPAGYARSATGPGPAPQGNGGGAGGSNGGGGRQDGGAGRPGASGGRVEVGPSDLAAFERILSESQEAYSREDLAGLSRLATPEMVRYFAADLEANRARGVRNEVSGARLLQGDLSEAWRERDAEFATVAMRFTVVDVTVDRSSGRVVEGNRDRPAESTEVWTFLRRGPGMPWLLSAIQQAS